MRSDEQIICGVIKGNTEDFRELIHRYQENVFKLAYSILGRIEDAEDAVQEVFLLIHKNLASCRERTRFWVWARRITINACLRRLPREIPSDEVEALVDASWAQADTVQAEAIRRADRQLVQQAVSQLPAGYKTVIVLRYEEELSYNEIADLLKEPVSRIQVRIHRAKKLLAKKLAGVMLNAM